MSPLPECIIEYYRHDGSDNLPENYLTFGQVLSVEGYLVGSHMCPTNKIELCAVADPSEPRG